MIVQVQVHVDVYVHKPELSVDIVTLHGSLDHWIMLMLVIHSISDQERDESPMQRCICLQTDHKIPNMRIKIRSEHDRMCL